MKVILIMLLYSLLLTWGTGKVWAAMPPELDLFGLIFGFIIIYIISKVYYSQLKQNYDQKVQQHYLKLQNFDWYCQKFPDSHNGTGGNICCNRCKSRSIQTETIYGDGAYLRFNCRNCGNTLFYTKQGIAS